MIRRRHHGNNKITREHIAESRWLSDDESCLPDNGSAGPKFSAPHAYRPTAQGSPGLAQERAPWASETRVTSERQRVDQPTRAILTTSGLAALVLDSFNPGVAALPVGLRANARILRGTPMALHSGFTRKLAQ